MSKFAENTHSTHAWTATEEPEIIAQSCAPHVFMYMYMYMYHACTYMFMPFNFGACPTSSIAHAYNRTSLDRNIHIAKPGAKQ